MPKSWYYHALQVGSIESHGSQLPNSTSWLSKPVEFGLSSFANQPIFVFYIDLTILFIGFVPSPYVPALNAKLSAIENLFRFAIKEFHRNYPNLDCLSDPLEQSLASISLSNFTAIAYLATTFQHSVVWFDQTV